MRKKKIFSPHFFFFFHLLTWLLIFPWSNNLNFCNSQLAKTLSDWIAFLFTSSSNIDDVDLFPFVQPWLYVNVWHITIVIVNDKTNKIRIWELTICNIKRNMFILKWYVIRLKKKKYIEINSSFLSILKKKNHYISVLDMMFHRL